MPGPSRSTKSSGYRPFGRRRRYYDGRIDALRFEKPLAARIPPQTRLTPIRESVLMVDIAAGAVASRFDSGYDESRRLTLKA